LPKFCLAVQSTICTLSSTRLSAMPVAHAPLLFFRLWFGAVARLLPLTPRPALGKPSPSAGDRGSVGIEQAFAGTGAWSLG
jgi:hypothetical protein